MVSERQKTIPDVSYTDSAIKFFDLIPECISETLDPEVLVEHFVLYVQQELSRLNSIESALEKGVTLSKSEVTGIPLVDNLDDSHSNVLSPSIINAEERCNLIFPLWAFKYDGTDVLHASRKHSFGELEEYFEDDLFEYAQKPFEDLNESQALMEPCTDFKTLSELSDRNPEMIQPSNLDDNPAILIPSENISTDSTEEINDQKAKRKSEDIHQEYLGPFLETLYRLVGAWTRTEPDIILIVTEILSVLASSRIPLLTGLILDLSTVLQPYYPSFSNLVHTVRVKLDGSMQKYPSWLIKNIWQKSVSGSTAISVSEKNSQQNSSQIHGETFRHKFMTSAPFSAVSKLSRGSPFAKFFTVNENR